MMPPSLLTRAPMFPALASALRELAEEVEAKGRGD